jgi:hypothetical protein
VHDYTPCRHVTDAVMSEASKEKSATLSCAGHADGFDLQRVWPATLTRDERLARAALQTPEQELVKVDDQMDMPLLSVLVEKTVCDLTEGVRFKLGNGYPAIGAEMLAAGRPAFWPRAEDGPTVYEEALD